MTVAVINDVHLGPERPYRGEILKLSRFAGAELNNFLASISSLNDIDVVVQLGDLIEDENYYNDANRYREAVQHFNGLPQPVYHAVGNHEQAFLGDEDLRAWLGYTHLFYAFQAKGYLCLVLYSEHRRGMLPRIGLSQLAWIEEQVHLSTLPVIVFVHHPLDDQSLMGNPWFEGIEEQCLVENRAEVRGLLERSHKVVAVVSAHAHWHNITVCNGIIYITLQSLVEKVAEDTPASSWVILSFQPGYVDMKMLGWETRCISLPLRSANVESACFKIPRKAI